jgi:hypothetical protein
MERHKMTNPIIRIFDVTTNETIEREMTNAEVSIAEKDKEIGAKKIALRQEDKAARNAAHAKLAALGLTGDDLKALGL